MKESGILNRDIAAVLSEQGHGDLLMVTDAGFAIPQDVEVIDLFATNFMINMYTNTMIPRPSTTVPMYAPIPTMEPIPTLETIPTISPKTANGTIFMENNSPASGHLADPPRSDIIFDVIRFISVNPIELFTRQITFRSLINLLLQFSLGEFLKTDRLATAVIIHMSHPLPPLPYFSRNHSIM